MRDDTEVFDVDPVEVARIVRGVVDQALMQVTGRLDADAPRRDAPGTCPACCYRQDPSAGGHPGGGGLGNDTELALAELAATGL